MKYTKFVSLVLLIILMTIGCAIINGVDDSSSDNNHLIKDNGEISKHNESNTTNQYEEEKKQKELIMKKAEEAIYSLRDKDMVKLSILAHPKKGIRFTPNQPLDVEKNVVLYQEDIKNYFEIDEVYFWGHTQNSGLPIELTPREYYEKYIYDYDYLHANKIDYYESDDTWIYNNTIFVEYYVDGTYDWHSLNFVFEEYDNDWYIVGIMRFLGR